MIDFRYHIVSLVAVFLALATGLVLGSTVLDKPVLEGTKKTANDLSRRNSDLRAQLLDLQSQQHTTESFMKAMAPTLLAGRLSQQRVVVVEAPGADGDAVDQLTAAVKQAGATVTGTVALQSGYLDKEQIGVLGGLTETLAKTDHIAMPADAVPAERAAILLSRAVVTRDRASLGRSDQTAQGILQAFTEANFVKLSGTPSTKASLALLVAPDQPYEETDAQNQNAALVSLAVHLDRTGNGSTVTGPSTSVDADGLVAALRADDGAEQRVSSVDNLHAPPGRVTTVLALAADGAGRAGQWGSGAGANAAAPTPAPGSP